MRYIVDDINAVVQSCKEIEGGAPFYQYGRRVEIANRLAAMDKLVNLSDKKYPVIALIYGGDEETVVNGLVDWNLTIIIATLTRREYTTQERYDNSFKPILIPLYETFLIRFKQSGLFIWPGNQKNPPHKRALIPYWGTSNENKNEKLILDDPLDAIVITDLKINSTNKPCP